MQDIEYLRSEWPYQKQEGEMRKRYDQNSEISNLPSTYP